MGEYPIIIGHITPQDFDYVINCTNATLTITPAPLTITANNAVKVYGAALPILSASYSGLVNGDTAASLTILPTLSTTAAASSHVLPSGYAIIASGASDPDYNISYQTGTLLVTPASLTITANNATKVYGASMPALSVSYIGFVNGDGPANLTTPPSITTTATSASLVLPGGYPVTTSGASDPDYAITYQPGKLLITPAPLTITANNASMYQGTAVPPLSVSYSGFVDGDSSASLVRQPTVTTPATLLSPAGSYHIVPAGASDPNYTISYVDGVLAIAPAPVPIVTQALVLWNQQHNKKGKPVGKPTLAGFEFGYNIVPTSANYLVDAYVSKRVGRKLVQVSQPVSCSVQTAGTMVKLILNGKQTFADGGLITGTCGSYKIVKNAKSISVN